MSALSQQFTMAALSQNYQHNKSMYDRLRIGDRVEFKRGIYSHWGIHIGRGRIVHLSGSDDLGKKDAFNVGHSFSIAGKLFSKAEVRIDHFWDVVEGDKAYINNSLDTQLSALDVQTIVTNATKRIGEVGYNLIYSNCEHFTNWCRYGACKSEQAENLMTGVAVGGAVLLGVLAAVGMSRVVGSRENQRR